MLRHRRLGLLLLLFLCLPLSRASAQSRAGNISIYVTYPDDRAPTEQLRVALIGGATGTEVAETYTNDHGRAQFLRVAMGTYQVSVSGQSIQPTTSETFEVDERKSAQSIFVRAPHVDNGEGNGAKGGSSPVSANDLRVPEKASQEFDKATSLIANQQWQKAIDQLKQALALYPAYAEAYNNLGVVYAHLGDSDNERQALQKAIAANDHFAPAFVNLARMEMKEHNFAAAEAHLDQAASADPSNVPTLVLLTQSQLLDHHYEDAIAGASKVHSMSHDPHALVHYVAARACERLNRLPDAVSQFNLFLTEEPSGERAAAVRQELGALQKQLQ
jgi:tetratricopeptide (TPR) repeat protein